MIRKASSMVTRAREVEQRIKKAARRYGVLG